MRLLLLRFRAWILVGQVEHGEGLVADHQRRLDNCRQELDDINDRIEAERRRSLLAQKPERLIRETA